ncbi:hypothetical protein EMWEY_00053050, partial [Eimeria maxima]
AKYIFLLQHHQFYWRHWEEPDDSTTKIEVRQMKIVRASFHGHLHSDSDLKDEEIQQIVTSSCGFATNDGRPGWRLVQVDAESVEHKFIPVEWKTKEYPFLPPRFS